MKGERSKEREKKKFKIFLGPMGFFLGGRGFREKTGIFSPINP